MDVWITLIEDRRSDANPLPFSTEAEAVAIARTHAPYGTEPEPLNDAMREDGWVLWLPYGTEGARVRVVRRAVDGG